MAQLSPTETVQAAIKISRLGNRGAIGANVREIGALADYVVAAMIALHTASDVLEEARKGDAGLDRLEPVLADPMRALGRCLVCLGVSEPTTLEGPNDDQNDESEN